MKPNSPHPLRDKYQKKIDTAILELIKTEKEGFYNIPRLSWWNFKYKQLDNYCFEHRHTDSCIEGMGCACAWNSPESTFHDLYSSLDKVLDLHMNEKLLKAEMEKFNIIRDDKVAVNEWLMKNSELGTEYFMDFWIEWYVEEKNVIKPFIANWQVLEITFKGEEWKYTIDFLKIFNDKYWNSDLEE